MNMKITITEEQLNILIKEQYQVTATNSHPPQNSTPVVKTIGNTPFWASVIDFFLPGTPVEDGYDLINEFSDIIQRRIEYNTKNKLPIDTLTPEEKSFREKILKATPNYGYPDIFGLSKIIQDIKQGKNIQQTEFQRYKKTGVQDFGYMGKQKYSDQELKTLMGSRNELKKMWLGLDEPGDQNKGYWVKSEFKPSTSTNSNTIYYKPKEIPKLTPQQFDELYSMIMKTKKPDGKFPGGNSSLLFNNKFKFVDANIRNKIQGDLGHFKLGAAEENGKKYISVYDEWDLVPPSLKKIGVDIQKFGKIPLIYYRIYRP